MDTTEHMGHEAVEAHLLAEHPWMESVEETLTRGQAEPSAAILRGRHDSDHFYAGEESHPISGDITE